LIFSCGNVYRVEQFGHVMIISGDAT
jgi:hypothetical protein